MNNITLANILSTETTTNVDTPSTTIESLSLHELEFVAGGSGCDNLGKI